MQDNDQQLRDAMSRVTRLMDSLSPGNGARQTTTDAPMVFFNGFNRWCAKFSTHAGKDYHAFGDTLHEALTRLADSPTIS